MNTATLNRKTNVCMKREGSRVWIEGAEELFHQHFEDSKNGSQRCQKGC